MRVRVEEYDPRRLLALAVAWGVSRPKTLNGARLRRGIEAAYRREVETQERAEAQRRAKERAA